MSGLRTAAREIFLFLAGLLFLTLAKAKNLLQGYTSPKPFALSDIGRCVTYDIDVVDAWLDHLAAYAGSSAPAVLRGKAVLELGPGSDVGTGVTLLARGADNYGACDVHDLTRHAPREFYSALIERLARERPPVDSRFLESQVDAARAGEPSRLRMVVRDDFDLIDAFGRDTVDLVFSQAAFEHFDDLDATIEQLSAVCKPGAIIVAQIDLKTHSRWIRDHDPNNIYRYPDLLYSLFWFRGTPNRTRPCEYQRLFERHGWSDVLVTTTERTTAEHPNARWVLRRYREPKCDMESLSVVLCARLGAAVRRRGASQA